MPTIASKFFSPAEWPAVAREAIDAALLERVGDMGVLATWHALAALIGIGKENESAPGAH
jgi:hypothetical protein